MEFSADCLLLTPDGGHHKFAAAQSDQQGQLDELILGVCRGLQHVVADARPSEPAGRPTHTLVVAAMAALEGVAKAGFSSRGHSTFAAKCKEHLDYLLAKCAEQTAAPPSTWNKGISFRVDTPDARQTIARVVGETLMHVRNHMARDLASEGQPYPVATASDRNRATDNPIAFAIGNDDSAKQRRYMYVGNETAIVEMHDGFSLFLDLRDLSLVPTLLQTGWWEPWIDHVLRSLLSPGMSYVNAGANVGYHACLGAKLIEHTGKAFAFEANPRVFALLRRSIFYNGFSERMQLLEAAVGEKQGLQKFYFVREQFGQGAVYEPDVFKAEEAPGVASGTYAYGRSDYDVVDVRAVTLDETVGRQLDSLDVLHMDIEGSEGPAILGAADLIARSRELRIVLEWSVGARNDAKLHEQHKSAAEFLLRNDFRFYRIVPPKGNVFSTAPDLARVEPQDLLSLPHSDLFATRS